KSVALNAILLSLLMGVPEAELKLVLIDPKRLEFGLYRAHRQLLVPVVTESSEALRVLRQIVAEMEGRYQTLERCGVRHVDSYNRLPSVEPLPYIVVAIDELGDLMMTTPREVEDAIVRLAQLARAVGIHLIVATQRPSYDVITGRIKANFPARMAFRTASPVDSAVILGVGGAEKLLGRGDMLLMRPGAKLHRLHGALVTDDDVLRAVEGMRVLERPAPPQEDVAADSREVQRARTPLMWATAGLAGGLVALLWALSV
ncbi:MAG: DNA translocase FtsK, partial [Acidobacteria bacterium]|nr:DNA translocase FtsK [Acidobacteriota bacterium]